MFAAVIMFFVIFSFTGVAVLDISAKSSLSSLETVNNIKLQYEVESAINEALWRINTSTDSLVNFTSDDLTCSWNPTDNILSVEVDMYGVESAIELDLSEDNHFKRGLATNQLVNPYGYTSGIEDEHQMRQFGFMPQVDEQYFRDNAVKIHNANDQSWKEGEVSQEGIHVFTGNNIEIDSLILNNSTLVFTGKGITITGTNTIRAGIPADAVAALPALVFTDPEAVVTIVRGTHIEGAIYCAGQIILENATLSGPIVSPSIALAENLDLLDAENDVYYRWNLGFGDQSDYDWPKQINRWKVNKWIKNSAS
ncbi:MAG: hypothetical protein K9N35_10760 [Candidatus Marinimicrobia bacterium]|nr:hypothetical protein [Candidatus Neomarinimicrobiota bacterium]